MLDFTVHCEQANESHDNPYIASLVTELSYIQDHLLRNFCKKPYVALLPAKQGGGVLL
jgi:hypothetical protein